MAACGRLQHIFEKPLPESPTLLESLSPWKQIKSVKTIEDSSYAEIFGELHFKEHHVESASSSSSPLPQSYPTTPVSSLSFFAEVHPQSAIERLDKENNESPSPTTSYCPTRQYRHSSDSFSSMNSENLSLCTEGLGFESSDDIEDLGNEASFDFQNHEEKTQSFSRHAQSENSFKETKRSRTNRGSFPPPISCIGRTGKPWVCFKSYREDGRFILQEIRIPTQEFLHACREDGRLRLQFIQPDDEILEEDDREGEDDVDDNDIEAVEETNKETKGADNEDQDLVRIEENRCNDSPRDVQI